MIALFGIVFFPAILSAGCLEGDCVDGWGKMVTGQGYEYEGQWKNGRPHGKGTVKTHYGTVISGDNWVHGKLQGNGVETYSSGRKYVGQFKNTKYHGIGTDHYPNGQTYRGEFKDGHPSGKGKLILADGSIYEGEFKDGLSNGRGKLLLAEGHVYIGEFFNGHPQGQGALISPDGSKYVGEFHKGHQHGYGVQYSAAGKKTYSGLWTNGREARKEVDAVQVRTLKR